MHANILSRTVREILIKRVIFKQKIEELAIRIFEGNVVQAEVQLKKRSSSL